MSRFLARLSVIAILVTGTTTLFVMDRFFTRAAKAGAVACGGGKGRPAAVTARRPMASFTIARGPRTGRSPLPPVALVTRRPLFLCSRGGGAGDGSGDREEDTPVIQPFKINAFNTPDVRPGYVCVIVSWDGESFLCSHQKLIFPLLSLPHKETTRTRRSAFRNNTSFGSSLLPPPLPPPRPLRRRRRRPFPEGEETILTVKRRKKPKRKENPRSSTRRRWGSSTKKPRTRQSICGRTQKRQRARPKRPSSMPRPLLKRRSKRS